jgi:hypothetical protein
LCAAREALRLPLKGLGGRVIRLLVSRHYQRALVMSVSNVGAASTLLLKKELRGTAVPALVVACAGRRVCMLLTHARGGGGHNNTELQKSPVEGFSAGLVDDNNMYEWEILIMGPPDTL